MFGGLSARKGTLENTAEELITRGGVSWITGPEYVESVDQMLSAASTLSELGTRFLRARAYWPDAREKDFRRHLIAGLKLLKATAKHFGLHVVSEIVFQRDVELMAKYCDAIEVGPERAADFSLLKSLSGTKKTIIVHRHPMMTIEQYLSVIEYLERQGCSSIVLVENGIRGFDPFSRNLMDLSSIITLRRHTTYPILVDCSRMAKDASYTESLAVTAIAAGADGILADLGHPQSSRDNQRALVPLQLQGIMQRANALKYTLNALAHHKYQND